MLCHDAPRGDRGIAGRRLDVVFHFVCLNWGNPIVFKGKT